MSENDEKDLAVLQSIEKAIRAVVERSKTRTKIIAEAILKETGAPAETLREAIKLHYLRKTGRHYYEAAVASWEPIHFRNILNGVRARHAVYNKRWVDKQIKKSQSEKSELVTIPSSKEEINDLQILNAIQTLRRFGCTGEIIIHIKL